MLALALLPAQGFNAYSRDWLLNNIGFGSLMTLAIVAFFFPLAVDIARGLWGVSQRGTTAKNATIVTLAVLSLLVAFATRGIGAVILGLCFLIFPVVISLSIRLYRRCRQEKTARRLTTAILALVTLVSFDGVLVIWTIALYEFSVAMGQFGDTATHPDSISPLCLDVILFCGIVPMLWNTIYFVRLTNATKPTVPADLAVPA